MTSRSVVRTRPSMFDSETPEAPRCSGASGVVRCGEVRAKAQRRKGRVAQKKSGAKEEWREGEWYEAERADRRAGQTWAHPLT